MNRVLKRLYPDPHIALAYGSPWELLVAVQLSAQCTDKRVNEVTNKLFKKYRTLGDYARAEVSVFEKDIYACGFYKNKTRNILAAAKIVEDDFGGKVPRTAEKLQKLPGVGYKTAHVIA